MDSLVAPALGIPPSITYDSGREAVIAAFRSSFMTPVTDKGIMDAVLFNVYSNDMESEFLVLRDSDIVDRHRHRSGPIMVQLNNRR